MNRITPSVANGCLEPLWPLFDEDVGVEDDHRSAGILGGEQAVQGCGGETALARLSLELVHGSRDLAVLRGDQITVERHRQKDAEIALMPLDDHRLLDAVVEELPEILPGFGSGHGFHLKENYDKLHKMSKVRKITAELLFCVAELRFVGIDKITGKL